MKKTSNKIFIALINGFIGSALTIIFQLIFPSTIKLNLTINGEKVIVTQEKYTNLYNENTELKNELEGVKAELEQTKECLSTAQSNLSEAEEKITTLSNDMPKFEYSDLGINKKGISGNNYTKGFLNIDGRNFILLDSVQDIVGEDVSYEDNTLYIGHTTAEKVYLMDICPPYDVSDNDRYSTETFKMTGINYEGFSMYLHGGSQYALINLNKQFSLLEFDFGHVDGSYQNPCTLNIYLDNNLIKTVEQQPDSDICPISVPLNYGKHLKIEIVSEDWHATYGFGDLKLQY
ncbi:MAG: hypothetical protein NC240_04820 [Clostridium sp.]|nr:hypothetical protein [Clostridium sp.]